MGAQRQVSTPVAVIVIAVVVLLIAGIVWFRAPKKGPASTVSQDAMKSKMQQQMEMQMKGGKMGTPQPGR